MSEVERGAILLNLLQGEEVAKQERRMSTNEESIEKKIVKDPKKIMMKVGQIKKGL